MSALEDVETQKRGVVALLYHLGVKAAPEPKFYFKMPLIATAIPMHMASGHMCLDDSNFLPLISMFLSTLDSVKRPRHKLHRGKSFRQILAILTGVL